MKKKARAYVMELINDAQARLDAALDKRDKRETWRAVEDMGEAQAMLHQLVEYQVSCAFVDDGDSIDDVHPPGGYGGWAKDLDLSDEQGRPS